MELDDVRRKIDMLRNKTVANGASPGEAQNAADKADELERLYGLGTGRTGARPAAQLVIVTLDQHRAMRRGETVTVVRRQQPNRYRIADGRLVRWTADDGESWHAIVSVSTTCRNVVIRFA